MLTRIDATLTNTLPHLATKAELAYTRSDLIGLLAEMRASLAEKPSKAYLWGVPGVLVAAMVNSYAAGLAAIALH